MGDEHVGQVQLVPAAAAAARESVRPRTRRAPRSARRARRSSVRATNARAIATRCRCPPESSRGCRPTKSAGSAAASSAATTRSSFGRRRRPGARRPAGTSAAAPRPRRTRRIGDRRRRTGSGRRSGRPDAAAGTHDRLQPGDVGTEQIDTCPTVAGVSPVRTRAVVDLPLPDSPTMENVSPRPTSNEIPSTAGEIAVVLGRSRDLDDGLPPGRGRPVADRRESQPGRHAVQQSAGVGVPRGRRSPAAVAPTSTRRPSCMTPIRSDRSAATPRSWVTSTTLVPMRVRSSSIRSSTCFCTVASRPEVGSSAMIRAGFDGDGRRDQHPLPHAAGQLVRVLPVPPVDVGEADQLEQLVHPAAAGAGVQVGVQPQHVLDLVADPAHRVQRHRRVLRDQADRPPADIPPALGCQIGQHRVRGAGWSRRAPPVVRQGAEDGVRGGGLARAGLADQGEHLPGFDGRTTPRAPPGRCRRSTR